LRVRRRGLSLGEPIPRPRRKRSSGRVPPTLCQPTPLSRRSSRWLQKSSSATDKRVSRKAENAGLHRASTITINYVNNANVPAEVCPAVNISRYHAGDCALNLAGFEDAPQDRHTCKCLRTVDSGGRVLAG